VGDLTSDRDIAPAHPEAVHQNKCTTNLISPTRPKLTKRCPEASSPPSNLTQEPRALSRSVVEMPKGMPGIATEFCPSSMHPRRVEELTKYDGAEFRSWISCTREK